MPVESLTDIILQYRYWILIPLSLVEGPIIAFVAGTLAAVGVFDIYFLAVVFFVRDIGLDAAYYAVGYFSRNSAFAQRMLKKIGITEDHMEKVQHLWVERPLTTLFIGKLSYGIASAFIVVAGMVKMPLRIFFGYGTIVAITQYGALLFLGYFLGASFGDKIGHIINNIQYVIAGAAVIIVGYYLLSLRARNKLLEEDKKIEDMPV